jgi:cell envelope opacity-associated protein A
MFGTERDARALSVRSGISEVTLRQIAATGRVNSYVTAVALEIATNSAIHADEITNLSTKGAQLYRREPARTLLRRSVEEGVSMAGLLRRHGLTNADLFAFMNAADGKSKDTKARVSDALLSLGICPIRTEPFEFGSSLEEDALEESI